MPTKTNLANLFPGPLYGPSNNRGVLPYQGPVAIAYKRIASRANPDLIPWQGFDNRYNKKLERFMKDLQDKNNLDETGQVGEPTYYALIKLKRKGHPGESAVDDVSRNILLHDYARRHPPKPPDIVLIKDCISEFLWEMVHNQSIWHYLQARPFRNLGRDPKAGGYSDCSEMVTCATYWVHTDIGLFVPDPNGNHYNGWGNTDTLWRHRSGTVHGLYQVGDYAIYGPNWKTKHTTMCRQAGTYATAIFSSNGSEAGPLDTKVYYRNDLLGVVRPRLIAT